MGVQLSRGWSPLPWIRACLKPCELLICYSVILVPWWTSKRVMLSGTCFIGFFLLYALRVNISIAIVAMVKADVDALPVSNATTNNTMITMFNATSNSTYQVLNPNATMNGENGEEGDDCPEQETSGTKIVSFCLLAYVF